MRAPAPGDTVAWVEKGQWRFGYFVRLKRTGRAVIRHYGRERSLPLTTILRVAGDCRTNARQLEDQSWLHTED